MAYITTFGGLRSSLLKEVALQALDSVAVPGTSPPECPNLCGSCMYCQEIIKAKKTRRTKATKQKARRARNPKDPKAKKLARKTKEIEKQGRTG